MALNAEIETCVTQVPPESDSSRTPSIDWTQSRDWQREHFYAVFFLYLSIFMPSNRYEIAIAH